MKFRGAERDCVPCTQRVRCLRKPQTTKVRQAAILTRKHDIPTSHTERMRRRIDSAHGKAQYARRFATVEPVFGNLRYNKKLSRFTLRGRRKVDTQWKLSPRAQHREAGQPWLWQITRNPQEGDSTLFPARHRVIFNPM